MSIQEQLKDMPGTHAEMREMFYSGDPDKRTRSVLYLLVQFANENVGYFNRMVGYYNGDDLSESGLEAYKREIWNEFSPMTDEEWNKYKELENE